MFVCTYFLNILNMRDIILVMDNIVMLLS